MSGVLAARYRSAGSRVGLDIDELYAEALAECLRIIASGKFDPSKGKPLFNYLYTGAKNKVAQLYIQYASPVTVPRSVMYPQMRAGLPKHAELSHAPDVYDGSQTATITPELLRALSKLGTRNRAANTEVALHLEDVLYGFIAPEDLSPAMRAKCAQLLRELLETT